MATQSDPPAENPTNEASASPPPAASSNRLDEANGIVQSNVYWSMGAGVLPLPVFDLVAITGVQLKMLRQLSALYDVPFREGLAKKAVTSLLVGLGGVGLGGMIGISLFKFVPVVGASLGAVSVPVISGMLTHAVGRTFVMHFEAGGTLLDFKPRVMREYFRKEYSKAKDVVSEVKKKGPPSEAAHGAASA
ncbi:MAG: DUF697 domain-containing protein [Myxococcota bacterium]